MRRSEAFEPGLADEEAIRERSARLADPLLDPARSARPAGPAGRLAPPSSAGAALPHGATVPCAIARKKPASCGPRRAAARGRTPARAAHILDRLEQAHPEAACALLHRNAYQLVVATILSAQCTDERVNQVTPDLFGRYPDPPALAGPPRRPGGDHPLHRLLPGQGEA